MGKTETNLSSRGIQTGLKRRTFLKGAAATAGGLILASPGAVFGSEANSKLRLGVIGCGGRGGWIADLFAQHSDTVVVAVHDYFEDRVTEVGERHGIPASRRHTGLDGYRDLLAGDVDAVAIISPPYFHPEQTAAALAAGKHVYLAKPIAVDVPGCQTITQAASDVRGRLSVLVDFQTRVDPFFQGAAERVHGGILGKVVTGQVHYHCGRLGLQTRPDGTEAARLRNWSFDKALSGDVIVEQNIHVLDVANWYLQSPPLKAQGTGGRMVRTDVGDCWDHFVLTFWYPDGVLVSFSSSQCIQGFTDLCCRLHGSEATVDSHYGGNVNIRGIKDGWRGGLTTAIYEDGAVANIKRFHQSILDGQYLDNTQQSANSTITCILGREAAYTGQTVTWDEVMAANTAIDAGLELPENGPTIPRIL
jgi:myo-inositol 2-dehydrogenase/D-chiro-inositol 1-dehydrogenase